jgi:hypothetical protein
MDEVFEQWRTISGYPNFMVSNFGRVMNVKTQEIKTGSLMKVGYLNICLWNGKSNRKYIHHLVAEAFLTKPEDGEKLILDHIDRNRTNNTALNLRWITRSQNNMNGTKRINTSSQYKGVTYNKSRNLWCATLECEGKKHYLGGFKTEDEAAYWYNEKAKEIFGEFACLNNVEFNPENSSKNALTSRFRGVHYSKEKKKWKAVIGIDYKNVHIGYYQTEVEAAKAFNKKATELLGDKAKLNIIN